MLEKRVSKKRGRTKKKCSRPYWALFCQRNYNRKKMLLLQDLYTQSNTYATQTPDIITHAKKYCCFHHHSILCTFRTNYCVVVILSSIMTFNKVWDFLCSIYLVFVHPTVVCYNIIVNVQCQSHQILNWKWIQDTRYNKNRGERAS